jgi:DNA-3-methyladenine glycosylase
MKKLTLDFYRRDDVLQVSRELIGKILVTNWNGIITSGRIIELEAYAGEPDKASHAYAGRRTKRNEIMYSEGGTAYIYLCYGIHHMFNVVTSRRNRPHAILIRALEPLQGIMEMVKRTGQEKADNRLTRGPGKLSVALGIHTSQNGVSLRSRQIYIADDGFSYPDREIAVSPRIGVDYAGAHAKLLYRFYVKGNPFVSGKPK